MQMTPLCLNCGTIPIAEEAFGYLRKEIERCNETLRAIEAVNVNEFGHTSDEAIKRLIDSHFANTGDEARRQKTNSP